jgi:hypothetical protein
MVRGKKGLFLDVILTVMLIFIIMFLFRQLLDQMEQPGPATEIKEQGKFQLAYQQEQLLIDLAIQQRLQLLKGQNLAVQTTCGGINHVWSSDGKQDQYCIDEIKQWVVDQINSNALSDMTYAHAIIGSELRVQSLTPFVQTFSDKGKETGQRSRSIELVYILPDPMRNDIVALNSAPDKFAAMHSCVLPHVPDVAAMRTACPQMQVDVADLGGNKYQVTYTDGSWIGHEILTISP